jgi:prepilin-type N-terminal cleavage/methylation domain-containing protein
MIFARMRSRGGTTLPELLVVLAILAVVATMTMPRVGRALDVYATRAARDGLAAAVGRARVLAIARGSAAVRLDAAAGSLEVRAPAGAAAAEDLPLSSLFGVRCELDGSPAAVVLLHFDALGIGRFSNYTLRCHRNGAEAFLTLSSYGRPRRW